MKKLVRYLEFINENSNNNEYSIPSYKEAVELCSKDDAPFYESKMVVDGYNVSVFNYRLAQYKDFANPLEDKPELKGYEMRGLTFVFNEDGSLFKRYVLLEKFFNLNQVPESMYSIVKNYKIKYVNNKEDGSIASFIKLPNGKIVGKSKMGFDNDQSNGINRIYHGNVEIKTLVDWCLDNDIIPIFEYVSPTNRIVLRYTTEELILLRLRDNKTGKHIDIQEHLDKVGSTKIAPFEDDHQGDLDSLIELVAKQIDKEGCIVQAVDKEGRDFFFKLKTPWYCERHGLLTDDIYREHVIIGYILDDKIDDILGQIPEEEVEAHDRINKIIKIVKKAINDKMEDIKKSYQVFLDMGENRKDYALKYSGVDEFRRVKEPNFGYVMGLANGKDLYELAKDYIREKTKRLMISRDWLQDIDPTLFFQDPEESEEDN
jgi:T4 RnlA family RNA ligase